MTELLFFVLGLVIGGLSIGNLMQYFKIKEMNKQIEK